MLRHIKYFLLSITILLVLTSCAMTIISPDLMSKSRLNIPINELRENPIPFQDKLFTFGAQIAETRLTPEGSLIEAVYIPIDEFGRPIGTKQPNTRIRAIFLKEYGHLDPLVFEKGRLVTIAGIFKGLQQGKIEELSYLFPYFWIEEIYLWERQRVGYYYPWIYDPYYDEFWRFRYGYRYYWRR